MRPGLQGDRGRGVLSGAVGKMLKCTLLQISAFALIGPIVRVLMVPWCHPLFYFYPGKILYLFCYSIQNTETLLLK